MKIHGTGKTKGQNMSKAFQIKGLPDYYITEDGDIYSRYSTYKHNPQGRIHKLKPTLDKSNGYVKIYLYKDGKKHRKYLHRLLAEQFIPNPENKPCINHKNGIRSDNRLSNIEWCSYAENTQHAFKVLGYKGSCFGKFGKDHPGSKIVLQIKDGKVIAKFYGILEAERETGIQFKNISAVCRGKRKTAGGFQWKYVENHDKI